MVRTYDHLKLPEDLLIEFFLRSSVKWLLCVKCVCKQWYSLIRNGNFVLRHLQYQKSHDKGRLLLQYFKEDIYQYKYVFFDDETLLRNSYHDLDNFRAPYDKIHMEGPVNGLYCFFNGCNRIILWNPAMMEVRILPLPQTHFSPHNDKGVIGFGIDSSSNDYILVLVRHSYRASIPPYVTVYNLTSNTWKLLKFGDFHLLEKFFCDSIGSSFLSGSYYWCTIEGKVIAFDMGEETFRHILGPDLALSEAPFYYYIMIYNDNVAFLQKTMLSVDVWVMLEEGIWTKQFSVNNFTSDFWIAGLWKNNEIFLVVSDTVPNFKMVLCNASTQEMINVGPIGNRTRFRASIYYESLVSVGTGSQHKGMFASLDTISYFFRSF